MLFYRARLEGPAEVLDVSLSPVRPVPMVRIGGMGNGATRPAPDSGPGVGAVHVGGPALAGRVRVVLRYGPQQGPVRTHRGWLYTDLSPGRRLRLTGCQVEGGEVLLSLAPLPPGAGRERLRDRFRLPFHLTSWGVEAATRIRTEVFCIPTARPGVLVLRGRAAVVLETPAARLVRWIPFCRRVAVDLNADLDWRARAAAEGVEVRVGPGGEVEGWLYLTVDCRGEPGMAGAAWDRTGTREDAPAAVRKVDAAAKRVEATVVTDGLALVSGAVELDVAWADRAGRGRWTCREVPFSALLPVDGLCAGDRLEPAAQVERLARVGKGTDERAVLLMGVGVTALRTVHVQLGGVWYRAEQVVGEAATTVEVSEALFPQEEPARAPAAPSRMLEVETGLHGAWTALSARIRRAGGRATLEVWAEPYQEGRREGFHAPATARVELPGDADAPLGLVAVGRRAVVRSARRPWDGGLEIALPRGTPASDWHGLPRPVHGLVDVDVLSGGLLVLLRCEGRLFRLVLPAEADIPIGVTVAGTAVPGAGMDRLWGETLSGDLPKHIAGQR